MDICSEPYFMKKKQEWFDNVTLGNEMRLEYGIMILYGKINDMMLYFPRIKNRVNSNEASPYGVS